MDGIGADKAQHRDAGDKDSVGQTGDLREAAAAESTDGEHEELHEHEACEEGVGHIGVLGEQLRSRSQSLDDEAAHQDRGDGFAGDTEGQHRDQGTAGDGVVRGFGAADALDGAVAEVLFVLGELLGVIVAHEAGDGCAGAGQDADDVADDPGADNGRSKHFLFGEGKHYLIRELCRFFSLLYGLLREDKDLRHREKTDQRAGDVDALGEERLSEHEALRAVDRVKADAGDQQTERAGHKSFDDALAGNTGDDGQAEDAEPELLCRHELQRELRQRGSEEIQGDAAEQTAPEGAPAGGRQRFTGLALQGHLVALDSGRRGSGGAGGVNEDSGDGAAEDSAAVDGAEDNKSGVGGHGEGQRQHQRNAHCGREAGQAADNDAERDTACHRQQVYPCQGMYEALTHLL